MGEDDVIAIVLAVALALLAASVWPVLGAWGAVVIAVAFAFGWVVERVLEWWDGRREREGGS